LSARRDIEFQKDPGQSGYVDMLTLLLCFFIIFFNSKTITDVDENSILKKVLTSMNQNTGMAVVDETTNAKLAPGAGAGAGAGEGAGKGPGAGGPGKGTAATEGDLVEQIRVAFQDIVPQKQ